MHHNTGKMDLNLRYIVALQFAVYSLFFYWIEQMPPVMDEEPERSATESTMMGSRSQRGPSVRSTSPIPHPNIFQNHFDSGAFRAAAENRTRKMAAEEESGFSFRPAARVRIQVI
jgi:hypothetical protein